MKRYNWDKKLILKFVIFLILGITGTIVSRWLEKTYGAQFDHNDNMRYLWQFFWLLEIVGYVYCLFRIPKLLPAKLKQDILQVSMLACQKIAEGFHKAYYAVRHALGIPDPPKRTRARDQRSFVFDMEDNDLVRRFRNLGGGMKWKDLKNNADKIRFIYIKYINKLMKQGYIFSTILTPMETLAKWKMEEDESAYMFPLYTDARYSGGRRQITDEEVERSSKYMKVNFKPGK